MARQTFVVVSKTAFPLFDLGKHIHKHHIQQVHLSKLHLCINIDRLDHVIAIKTASIQYSPSRLAHPIRTWGPSALLLPCAF